MEEKWARGHNHAWGISIAPYGQPLGKEFAYEVEQNNAG